MAFNVNDFKSKGLTLGGARPTLFQVTMNLPTAINPGTNLFQPKFAFTCSAATIPASTIDPINVGYFGRH